MRSGIEIVAGIVILLVVAFVYATGALNDIAGMLVLAVGIVTGVALLYLGGAQRRDDRRQWDDCER
jgi:membrane protein DedA with SNARE-associated domain